MVARALAAALLALLAACGEDTEAGGQLPIENPEPTMTVPAAEQARVAAAVADLATRQQIDLGEVKVVQATAVQWRDGSLGCPQPGMSYIQAITPGFLLVLESQGVRYEYHGGAAGPLTLCENPQPPASQ